MPTGSRTSAGNIDAHRDSILLLFSDHEAAIVRDWQLGKKHDVPKDDRDAA